MTWRRRHPGADRSPPDSRRGTRRPAMLSCYSPSLHDIEPESALAEPGDLLREYYVSLSLVDGHLGMFLHARHLLWQCLAAVGGRRRMGPLWSRAGDEHDGPCRNRSQPALIHEQYWELPLAERNCREKALQQLPTDWAGQHAVDGLPAYEASQPPLYYGLIAVPLRVMRQLPLLDRVWFTRLITLLLGSLTIPVGFILALSVFGDEAVAMGVTALVAVMPGMAINLARVSNECLGTLVFTVLFLTVCDRSATALCQDHRRRGRTGSRIVDESILSNGHSCLDSDFHMAHRS
jgi:hypothetical protein